MEDLFKKLNPTDQVPDDLKKELISSLDNLTLFADIVDLFTAKAIESKTTFLDLATPQKEVLSNDEDDGQKK